MVIREAVYEDMEGVARVLVAAWSWAFSPFLPPEVLAPRIDLDRRTQGLQNSWPRSDRFLVAEEGGRIVGMAVETLAPREGSDAEIQGLYVHPDAVRTGIGRALVGEMARGFLARGARSMAIHTLAENRVGRGFYERIGGRLQAEDEWNGFPAVWYVWDEAALARLGAPVPPDGSDSPS